MEMDDIPVRKLYVANFPNETTIADLEEAFKTYGDVENVSIVCKNRTRKNFAFVTFRDTAALKLALEGKDYLPFDGLLVTTADAWHQPDFVEPSTAMSALAPTVEQDYNGTIFILNDDCFLKIFSYMDLTQLLRLADVCWRFRSICEYVYSTYKSLDLEQYPSVSSSELRLMFHNIGPYLQSLKATSDNRISDQLLRMIARYCTNLSLLSLRGFQITYKVKNLHIVFKTLEKIDLSDCKISDKSLSYLLRVSRTPSQASLLKEVNLSGNYELTGSALVDMVGVTLINLRSCVNLQPKYFLQFVANNKELRELNIIRCDRLNRECIEAIASNLQELERLHLSNSYQNLGSSRDLLPLTELRQLRHLQIDFIDFMNVDTFLLKLSENVPLNYLDISNAHMTKYTLKALVEFKELRCLKVNNKMDLDDNVLMKVAQLQHLEQLEMVLCTSVTNEGVLDLITRCVHLKELNISGCFGLTDDLVTGAVSAVENREHVLTLIVGGTKISEYSLTNTNLGRHLKLDFTTNSMESYYADVDISSDDLDSDDEDEDFEYYHNHDHDDNDQFLCHRYEYDYGGWDMF